MMERYLAAAIRQAYERARVLKTKIPKPVPAPEMLELHRLCESRLQNTIKHLKYMEEASEINHPAMLPKKIRLFRGACEYLAQLESTGVAALNRSDKDDIFFSKLVFRIHHEISFPLSPPSVTCLSRQYYRISTSLKLIEVPLAEAEFLLHLPDLYHEMAHLLVAAEDDPGADPFQHELGRFHGAVMAHFTEQQAKNARSTGPKQYTGWILDNLEDSWVMYWTEEVFCDLFALYAVGPAFAWAHFHLTAERGGDPFEIRNGGAMSHPPAAARMQAMLAGLELMGYAEEGRQIKEAWDSLVGSLGNEPSSLFLRACPDHLMEQAAVHALEGTRQIGCSIAEPGMNGHVRQLLNEAWQKFWEEPMVYPSWEKKVISKLKQNIGSSCTDSY